MTFLNSIQLHHSSVSQEPKNLTFFEQITLIKTEIERSTINVLELKRQLSNLTPYLEKAPPEDTKEAFKVLNQVKNKIQISGNDWEENFKDLKRKFIQADLINWENICEIRREICKVSKRILRAFDDNLIILNMTRLKLNSLPESFGQLSRLRHLYVPWNQFESLPQSFKQLSQLQTLHIYHNQLTSFPKDIGQLSQLQDLCLDNNPFKSLHESPMATFTIARSYFDR